MDNAPSHANSDIKLALLVQRLGDKIDTIEDVHIPQIKETLEKIELKLEEDYISRSEFMPVRNIVYGEVGLILITVLGALIALVIK